MKKNNDIIMDNCYIYPASAKIKMDTAHKLNQRVYIYGVAGYGKTALIENYLKRKKYLYFDGETITEEYMKLSLEKSSDIKTIVIDNIQFVIQDEVKDIIKELLDKKDTWVIMAGRCKPPAWLLYYTINQWAFMIISQEELTLSIDETGKYLDMYGINAGEDDLHSIYNDSQGHAMLLKILCSVIQHKSTKDIVYNSNTMELAQQILCDYVETEVYDKWSPELLEFYIKVSIVDRFDVELAESITGKYNVSKIIRMSREIGNFLEEQDGIYSMIPAMIVGMRRRLREQYSKELINKLYYNAGCCYMKKGYMLKALEMFDICGDREQIGDILIENVRTNPATGYLYELKEYYLKLPQKMIENSIELMAGMSMLYSILMDIEESERWYDTLKRQSTNMSGSKKMAAKSWLAYLDIALPHRGSGNVLDLIKNSATLIKNRKITMPELSVTSNSPSLMNGGKDFCEWSRRDNELAHSVGKIVSFVLGKYGAGLVELALAESYFEKGMDTNEIISLVTRGQMQAKSYGKIENCFVATGLLMWIHVINGHIDDGRMFLKEFLVQAKQYNAKKLYPNIYMLFCRIDLYTGNKIKIDEWMETAPSDTGDFFTFDRYRYLVKIRIYIMNVKYDLAYGLLEKMMYYADVMDRTFIKTECMLLKAIVSYRQGDKRWAEEFDEAYRKAEEYHFVRIISREGSAVLPLLLKYHTGKKDIKDKKYLRQVLKETKNIAEYYPSYLRTNDVTEVDLPKNAVRILRMQAEGLSYSEIADNLNVTVATVNYHCKQTYKKLGVKDKASAVIEARKRKII